MYYPIILKVSRQHKLNNEERDALLNLWARHWDIIIENPASDGYRRLYSEYSEKVVNAFIHYCLSSEPDEWGEIKED